MTKSLSFSADVVTAGFTAADTNTSITHELARTPLAVFVIGMDNRAARIYKGTGTWTSTTVSLRSNTAGTGATLLLI